MSCLSDPQGAPEKTLPETLCNDRPPTILTTTQRDRVSLALTRAADLLALLEGLDDAMSLGRQPQRPMPSELDPTFSSHATNKHSCGEQPEPFSKKIDLALDRPFPIDQKAPSCESLAAPRPGFQFSGEDTEPVQDNPYYADNGKHLHMYLCDLSCSVGINQGWEKRSCSWCLSEDRILVGWEVWFADRTVWETGSHLTLLVGGKDPYFAGVLPSALFPAAKGERRSMFFPRGTGVIVPKGECVTLRMAVAPCACQHLATGHAFALLHSLLTPSS